MSNRRFDDAPVITEAQKKTLLTMGQRLWPEATKIYSQWEMPADKRFFLPAQFFLNQVWGYVLVYVGKNNYKFEVTPDGQKFIPKDMLWLGEDPLTPKEIQDKWPISRAPTCRRLCMVLLGLEKKPE